jgi:hypothetical protein
VTVQTLVKARAQYEADGFTIHAEPIIPADLVRRAIAGMDAVRAGEYETGVPPQKSYWNPGDDPAKLCKIEMPQVANRAILELVSHPALGELAAGLTGAEWVQVWWVQLLYKPPAVPGGGSAPGSAGGAEGATNVGWHQDRHYWQIWEEGSELFTAWVALSDVTAEAGPMRFVRGSHRWGCSRAISTGKITRRSGRRSACPRESAGRKSPPSCRPAASPFITTSPTTAAAPTGPPSPGGASRSTCARSAPPRWTAPVRG